MASSLPLPSSLALLVAILTALIFAPVVEPTTYQVSVGRNGNSYDPNTINTRNVGDKVVFNFYNNHSVVESDYTTPCVPKAAGGGFYSGFIASPVGSPAAPQHFVVTINDTQPHWFYCAQDRMCNAGMVGVINPPFEEPDDIAAYTVWAAETDPNASPEKISPPHAPIGGVISIESAAAAASTNNDDSYSYLLTAFASGPVAAPTNGSFVFTSNTTTKAVATSRSSAGSSRSSGSSITSVVMVTPTSLPALTSSTSATSSLPAPSASTTKKGTAGRVGGGDTGLAMLVLLGIMLVAG